MCCARPWESPPPRWTALSGPAPAGALAVLPGRGWPSSPSKCRLRYLCPLLLGEPELGLPGVPRALGESCVPLGHGAEPTLPTFSRDEGGQKLSVSSGPARGGHGEPDSSFIPRNAKKPHGTCPPEGGLPSACTSPSQGAVGEISLALVCPTSLSVTGEHTALRRCPQLCHNRRVSWDPTAPKCLEPRWLCSALGRKPAPRA